MLKGSRISRKPDVTRASRALQRPGIDPRMWCATCAVVAYQVDTNEGAPFCDVAVLHQDPPLTVTVRVAPFYAGPGFGFYAPYDVDDEVVVCFPHGTYDHGGYIVGRAWSPSDPMPDSAKNNQSDVCLVVKKDATLRLLVSGNGKVILGADGNGTQPVHRKGDHHSATPAMAKWMGQVEGVCNGVTSGAVNPLAATFATFLNPPVPPATGDGVSTAADGSGIVSSG